MSNTSYATTVYETLQWLQKFKVDIFLICHCGLKHSLYIHVDCSSCLISWCLVVNSSLPGQNGRHFEDDMFQHIFLNEKNSIGAYNGLTLSRWQAIIQTDADPVHRHIYVAPLGEELTPPQYEVVGWHIGFTLSVDTDSLSVHLSDYPSYMLYLLLGWMPISWNIFICGRNKPMRGWYGTHHFQANWSRPHGSLEVLLLVLGVT